MAKIGALALIVASPLIAVPAAAAPAVAATPEVVVSQVVREYLPYGPVVVTGTLTCSAPSGQAELTILSQSIAIGNPPLVWPAFATVPCASGPVPYSVKVFPPPPGALMVSASFTRDGVFEDSTTVIADV
ncbi:hypothetical protein WEI85_38370 [Actinomycetes bacterium KLBMP 9797]